MNKFFLLLCSFLMSWNITFSQEEVPSFYSTDHITAINITFKQSNWRTLLDSLALKGDGMLFGSVSIDGQTYKNVGVRYVVDRTYRVDKMRNPLHIKLNFINKNQNHQGYKSVRLSHSKRDPSMVREVMGYEIARQYMPAPKANYAKVMVNGAYYGLLVNVQDVDGVFLEEYGASTENTFIECVPDIDKRAQAGCKNKIFGNLEYEDGVQCYLDNFELLSEDGWDDLIELSRILAEEPEKIESVLDVDKTLWMHAFNNVVVNLSSYAGNYSRNFYFYQNSQGQFVPVMTNLNLAFGSYKNVGDGSDLGLRDLQLLDPLLHRQNKAKPLISKLLQNKDYEKIYLSHVYQIIYDHFVDGEYEQRAKELQQLISNDYFEDQNSFYDQSEFLKSMTTTIGKRSLIPGVKELMEKRARYLKKHPKLAIIPPSVTQSNVLGRAELSNKQVETFRVTAQVAQRPKRVTLYYRFAKNQPYQSMFMEDDGKHNDEEANDNLFGAEVDPEGLYTKMEYYIVAENPAALSYNPPSYMFAPYKTSLKELNK